MSVQSAPARTHIAAHIVRAQRVSLLALLVRDLEELHGH